MLYKEIENPIYIHSKSKSKQHAPQRVVHFLRCVSNQISAFVPNALLYVKLMKKSLYFHLLQCSKKRVVHLPINAIEWIQVVLVSSFKPLECHIAYKGRTTFIFIFIHKEWLVSEKNGTFPKLFNNLKVSMVSRDFVL